MDWVRKTFFGSIACIVLAIVMLVLAIIVNDKSGMLPIATMLFIVLGALLFAASSLLALYQILTAKNDNTWKLLWCAVILLIGGVGLILYIFIAQKDRKA